jgi:hypothetical protein
MGRIDGSFRGQANGRDGELGLDDGFLVFLHCHFYYPTSRPWVTGVRYLYHDTHYHVDKRGYPSIHPSILNIISHKLWNRSHQPPKLKYLLPIPKNPPLPIKTLE